ncbi:MULTISPECIES: hypothetical protein [Marinovum]|uniref:hypothetical protein n=1 Tax=Marinovum TaxID=367771 RepID=UPI00237B6425|nr:hypothetical protein [Marinovum sp. PR37]MDD9746679.1 hypothetical protein [Marinovum sp. PR37]
MPAPAKVLVGAKGFRFLGENFADTVWAGHRFADKWRVEEVVTAINGEQLRSAVDVKGDVLGVLFQRHRCAKAGKRVLTGLIGESACIPAPLLAGLAIQPKPLQRRRILSDKIGKGRGDCDKSWSGSTNRSAANTKSGSSA